MFDLIPFRQGENSVFGFFDNMERNFIGNAYSNSSQFRTDIINKGDRYVLHAELPGFAREDIKIDLSKNYLTIAARKEDNAEEKQENYIRRERKYGSFSRSYDVSGIQLDEITDSYQDGVLELNLPKAQPVIPPAGHIEIQ